MIIENILIEERDHPGKCVENEVVGPHKIMILTAMINGKQYDAAEAYFPNRINKHEIFCILWGAMGRRMLTIQKEAKEG